MGGRKKPLVSNNHIAKIKVKPSAIHTGKCHGMNLDEYGDGSIIQWEYFHYQVYNIFFKLMENYKEESQVQSTKKLKLRRKFIFHQDSDEI